MSSGPPSSLHPSSAIFGLGCTPDYVCCHEMISTSKEYMSCVTAVEGEWLAELGPMFFSIKESFESTLKKRQKQQLEAAAMEKQMADKLQYKKEEEEEKKKHRLTEKQQQKKKKKSNSNKSSSSTSDSDNKLSSSLTTGAIGKPGWAATKSSSQKFKPKKRGRLGL